MYNSSLHFHFTGIGGSGMSGIAEVLLNLGYRVSGTDQKASAITDRLGSLGAEVKIGHKAEYLPADASLVVYSSAVSMENPELAEAQKRGLPVVRRAEVLAELMRLKYGVGVAGSHGKTTTTSMTAAILQHGGLDPTVVIGGQFQNPDGSGSSMSGSRLGRGNYLVAETDESDRSFLLLKPTIAIVTNIDNEHLNAYSSLSELLDSFETYVKSVPFYGLTILGIDDPNVRSLTSKVSGRKLTYGLAPDAQLRCSDFEIDYRGISYSVSFKGKVLGRAALRVPARHLALNSLAAIAVGLEFGLQPSVIFEALNNFHGVKRRMETLAELPQAVVMSDYGHHPTEVMATLAAIKEAWHSAGTSCSGSRSGKSLYRGKITVVFQPHRYSRTRDCFAQFINAFSDCDRLFVSDIYSAGESPIPGIDSQKLTAAIMHDNKLYVPEKEDIFAMLHSETQSSSEHQDLIVFLGAGSVGLWGEQFVESIKSNGRSSINFIHAP